MPRAARRTPRRSGAGDQREDGRQRPGRARRPRRCRPRAGRPAPSCSSGDDDRDVPARSGTADQAGEQRWRGTPRPGRRARVRRRPRAACRSPSRTAAMPKSAVAGRERSRTRPADETGPTAPLGAAAAEDRGAGLERWSCGLPRREGRAPGGPVRRPGTAWRGRRRRRRRARRRRPRGRRRPRAAGCGCRPWPGRRAARRRPPGRSRRASRRRGRRDRGVRCARRPARRRRRRRSRRPCSRPCAPRGRRGRGCRPRRRPPARGRDGHVHGGSRRSGGSAAHGAEGVVTRDNGLPSGRLQRGGAVLTPRGERTHGHECVPGADSTAPRRENPAGRSRCGWVGRPGDQEPDWLWTFSLDCWAWPCTSWTAAWPSSLTVAAAS